MKKSSNSRPLARFVEITILFLLPVLLHFFLPIAQIVAPPYIYLGIPVMLAGLALTGWAARTFREARAGFSLGEERPYLVTGGPFRFTRNPIYLGMLLWLLGLAILLGSLATFILPIFVFLLANFILIPPEEKSMEQTFGPQFDTYRKRVRRWM
jgi:protein-S-isoprenylcysteine O-methyltransferase Ste14